MTVPSMRTSQAVVYDPPRSDLLLEVRDLRVHFVLDEGIVRAVDGVSYTLRRGRTLGVVGESGCGKSVTAQSVLRIVPRPGKIVGGEIVLHRDRGSGAREAVDLTTLDPTGKEIRSIRGNEISYIYQEPMSALSPVHTIGHHILEVIKLHQKVGDEQARAIAIDTLRRVGLPRADEVLTR